MAVRYAELHEGRAIFQLVVFYQVVDNRSDTMCCAERNTSRRILLIRSALLLLLLLGIEFGVACSRGRHMSAMQQTKCSAAMKLSVICENV
jgi:hypothetical protein